jgi:hypothetical protein
VPYPATPHFFSWHIAVQYGATKALRQCFMDLARSVTTCWLSLYMDVGIDKPEAIKREIRDGDKGRR